MSEVETGATITADDSGLQEGLATVASSFSGLVVGEPVTLQEPRVDAGWRSRKLIVGVVLALLVILLSSFLMFVAITGLSIPEGKAAGLLVKFDPKYWLYGVVAGLVFLGGCIGLISLDKLLDLARDTLPILKAKYLPGPKT